MQFEQVNVGALNKQNKKAWDDYYNLASQQAAQLEAQKAAQVQAALASYETSANTLTQNRDEAMRMSNVANSQQMSKLGEILGGMGLHGTGSGAGAYAKLLNSLASRQNEIESGYKGGLTDLEKLRMQADADAEKSYADSFAGINKDMISYYASLLANNKSSGGGGGGRRSSGGGVDNTQLPTTAPAGYGNISSPSTSSSNPINWGYGPIKTTAKSKAEYDAQQAAKKAAANKKTTTTYKLPTTYR